jgi:hypothetical protein
MKGRVYYGYLLNNKLYPTTERPEIWDKGWDVYDSGFPLNLSDYDLFCAQEGGFSYCLHSPRNRHGHNCTRAIIMLNFERSR